MVESNGITYVKEFYKWEANISSPIYQVKIWDTDVATLQMADAACGSFWGQLLGRGARWWEESQAQAAKHAPVINHRSCSTLACGEITGRLLPTPFGTAQASSNPGESLPDTSCCPGNPTGTMPKLFMAVAQAVGSVTDMLSWVVSIVMLPKPSAAVEKNKLWLRVNRQGCLFQRKLHF